MLVGLRSRKHIPAFELVKPSRLDEACAALSQPGRNVLMAGGLDLIDWLKNGEKIDRVVYLAGLRELSGIRKDGDMLAIGALTTHAAVARDDVLADALPDLPALWRGIANPRVRLTGTVGGNLMSGMPHYDAMPALLALGASVTVVDHEGVRTTLPLSDLAGRGDIILETIRVPVSPRRRLLADRSLHPVISVYLAANVEGDKIHSARVAVGCAHSRPAVVELPLNDVAIAALASNAASAAHASAAAFAEPLSDGLASASYRRRMIEVLTRRLLIKLRSQS